MPVILGGFEELLENMTQIDSRVTRQKILASAMRKSLVPLFDRFAILAPDDPATPGNRIRLYERKAVVSQSATSVLGKVGDTPKGFVGYLQEKGTAHMSAHPFASKAWEETQSTVESNLRTYLWAGLLGELVEEALDE